MKINSKWRAAAGVLCAFMFCSVPMPASAHIGADADYEASAWSCIEDELDNKLNGSDSAEYDGFIVKLKDDAAVMMMNDADDGIEAIENSDGYYIADDIDAAKELADLADIEYI